jgi:hypothetical protein
MPTRCWPHACEAMPAPTCDGFTSSTASSGSEGEAFDPGRDMPLLEAAAERLAAPRLLILDPIVSAVAGDSAQGRRGAPVPATRR